MGVADAFRAALPAMVIRLEAGFGADLKPEERLRSALAESLRAQPQIEEVVTMPEWRPDMRWWPRVPNGRLGGFDLSFRSVGAPAFSGVVETKWSRGGRTDALDEVLWDAFKLAHAAATLPGVPDAFLVYAATSAAWDAPPRFEQLFRNGVWATVDLIGEHPSVWRWLLGSSSRTRPTRLPPNLETALIAEARCVAGREAWLIRCARIRPNGDPWLEVGDDGFPQLSMASVVHDWWHPEPGPGMEPDPGNELAPPSEEARVVADEKLALRDVPGPQADWARIMWFASSCDGYRDFGGTESLGAFGNTVALFYQRLGELPPLDLHAFRACLFFEYRRHHHLGHAPDARSTAYIRALVEAIRQRVNKAGAVAAGP